MADDQTEWPTRARISKLRGEGKIAYSTFLTQSVLLIVVLTTLVVLSLRLPELLQVATKSFIEANAKGTLLSSLLPLLRISVEALIILISAALFAVLITILIQSRFLFSFSLFSFDFSRVAAFLRFNLLTAILRAILGVFLLALSILVGMTILWWYAYDLLVLFNYERREWSGELYALAYRLILGIGVGALIFGLLAYVWSRLIFLHKNRMSRREIDSESD